MVKKMMLSTKQKQIFTIAILLSSGKQVSATVILNEVGCSIASLSRYLRDLRETYNVTIKYSKSNHSYQLTDFGRLTPFEINQMKQSISKAKELTSYKIISLTKTSKVSISISLSKLALLKLESTAKEMKVSRSHLIETLINSM
ncbi:hypothetical protein Ga0061065_12049 [Marinomonas fungiae]|uniref:Ribbon-helix-helix protein, copG family n=1 Tax=Marinomonas fungiae TaxID=1137284 RepID=A0A0K6IUC8_9GAMM|nr:hypothetical protein Ga0061065_12049 [Marinomonas fungiae]